MQSQFVPLRLRSEYSIVDSIVRINPLMETLNQHKIKAAGISEFCNFFSAIKFYQAAIAHKIKPLLGVDIACCYKNAVDNVSLLSLLSMNKDGYKKATELVSKAYLEGQINNKVLVFYEWLENYHDGLICLSGASQGLIDKKIASGDVEGARQVALHLSSLFKDRFYLEIQRIGRKDEAKNNQILVALANELHLPLVATQEVRFLKPSEYEAHEVRVCIHAGLTLEDSQSNKRYTQEQYLKTPQEMLELFADLPESIANTVEISKRCTVKMQLGATHLPAFSVPDSVSESQYLNKLAHQGLQVRLAKLFTQDERKEKHELYIKRLDLELDVIQKMGDRK